MLFAIALALIILILIVLLNFQKINSEFQFLNKEISEIKKQNNDDKINIRDHLYNFAKDLREELSNSLKALNDNSRQDLAQVNLTLESKIKNLIDENSQKLEQMRLIVDEKLSKTLEQRLDSSFKQVSERLEQVHKGLGEMQSLAIGVGDLKKVLTNVKTRGTWGEIQLGSLLEQVLSPEQYAANVATKPKTQERVDFAIKLPGDENQPVWLPIDAKFPQEDYQRFVEASEAGNSELADKASKMLEQRIREEAKSIKDKYIEVPFTTDFALLFLPVESLFAEVIRRPGLVEKLQTEYRVNIVGPTTLASLLNSLQLGFRTLAIQKRSSEVWILLADIKKHFGAFGDLLVKAHEKVDQASKVIEDAGKRSRTIENKLKKVEEPSFIEAVINN